MNKEYLWERHNKTKNEIKKMLYEAISCAILLGTMECLMITKLIQYMRTNRIDLIIFTLVIGCFFGICLAGIWHYVGEGIDARMNHYKFCIDCAIEHEKIPLQQQLEWVKVNQNVPAQIQKRGDKR